MASSTPPITLSNFGGIDFNLILQSVVAVGQIPIAQINSQINHETAQISELGLLGGGLSSLQSSLTTFHTTALAPPLAANVPSNAPFSGAVTGAAVAGTYDVTVGQLAQAQISASQGYAASSSVVGTGTITITIGATAHDVAIDASHNTLSGVASSINAAAIGVTAQVVNTGAPGAPMRLMLSANSTGAANSFTLSSSLSGGSTPDFSNSAIGPASLDSVTGSAHPTFGGTYTSSLSQAYHFKVTAGGTVETDPITISYLSESGQSGSIVVPANYVAGSPIAVGNGITLYLDSGTLNPNDKFSVAAFNPTVSSAQDAQVQVGNQIVSAPTNHVTNAITGVTLSLGGTGGPSSVTVSQDLNGESNAVASFVNAYNSIMNGLSYATQGQPHQNTPPLAANGALESLRDGLQQALGTVDLARLGVGVDSHTGQLTYNSAKFAANAQANPALTTSTMDAINTALSPRVSFATKPFTGLVATQTTSIQNEIKRQNFQAGELQAQLSLEQTLLSAEYAQIQAQVSQYQSVQTYLDAQRGGSSSGSSAAVGSNLKINSNG